MQIPSTSTAYGGGEALRLLSRLLESRGPPPGQDLPGAASTASTDSTAQTAPTPPTNGPSGAQFATQTLASLLTTQQAPPSASDIAQKVISAVDSDGDGSLSLDEVEKALGQDTTSGSGALSQAFGQLDTNGDGKLSQDELASAISAHVSASNAHHHHHHHHAGGVGNETSGQLAESILGQADSNGDGALSADEIAQALGGTSASNLSQTIASLDKNGDGKLDSAELSAAIDAFRAANGQTNAGPTAQAVTA